MKYDITLYSPYKTQPGELYDHVKTAYLAGIRVRTLLRYWKSGIVEPTKNTGRHGIYFNDEAVYKLRQAEYLRREHSINLRGIQLILAFHHRIEELNTELNFWKK